MQIGIRFLFLGGLFLASLSPAGWGQDRVDLLHGKPLAGQVLRENAREVAIKLRGGRQRTLPADQVLDIVREGASDAYREGRTSLSKGDLKNAVRLLRNAAHEAKSPWLKEYATYYLARSLESEGRPKEAGDQYAEVLRLNPNSRFLPAVRLGLARTGAALGQGQKAIKVLQDFGLEVNRRSLPESYGLEAKTLLGKLLLEQGKPQEAASAFETARRGARKLLAQAKETSARRLAARHLFAASRSLAAAYIEAKDFSKARSIFQGLASEFQQDGAAQTLAAVGAAEVLLVQGNADLARVQLTEILAEHFDQETEVPQVLYLLGKAYLALAETGERGARQHARAYLQDLIKHYAASTWVAKGRKLLKPR